MSASDENEKRISQLKKRFDIRLSRDERGPGIGLPVSHCLHYSYAIVR